MESGDRSFHSKGKQLSIKIESPAGEEALTEFVLFQHRVYEYRSARWAAMVPVQLPILMGEGPFAAGRKIRPFAALVDGDQVARAVAIIDGHYQSHWKEPLGHIVMFEAMPGTRDGVKEMMDAASEWMKANGATAARAGYGLLEFPFVIDDYETLPPDIARESRLREWPSVMVEKTIELTGISANSVEDAVQLAVSRAGVTIKGINTVHVEDIAATVEANKVVRWKVRIKATFLVKDELHE